LEQHLQQALAGLGVSSYQRRPEVLVDRYKLGAEPLVLKQGELLD
jgi:hypothetical protein